MNETASQTKSQSQVNPLLPSSILQRKCTCGSHTVAGGECAECSKREHGLQRKTNEGFSSGSGNTLSGIPLQRKLTIGASDDPLEQEADRVADHVMAKPIHSALTDAPLRIQRYSGQTTGSTDTSPASVDRVLVSSGRPLEPALRQDMEQRFGHDFSRVRIHSGAAEQSARDVNAKAYTVGQNVVFGAGKFMPATHEGRRLIAHELTHVMQQSSGPPRAIQRQETFTGGPGRTALDKDRPLTVYLGPMPYTAKSGGTPIPNTAGMGQNCAGDSCSISKWINWPYLGLEVPKKTLPPAVQGDWARAKNFVPSGCTRVNCSEVDLWSTRCKESELELIAFLYKWPVMLNVSGTLMAGTQSDFHMIGRDATGLPKGWHSKMDRREKVADIRDPWQSLYDSYPDTQKKDRTIEQLCFCCNQSAIKTTKT